MKEDISCKELIELIVDYLEGNLDPEASKEFDFHIKDCIDCYAFLNTYKKTVSLSAQLPCEDIPEELRIRLTAFLEKKKGTKL